MSSLVCAQLEELMRTEIKNKVEYLNSLKELTIKLRSSANAELITQEILGIERDMQLNEFSQDEIDELTTIKIELQNIINNKR
jgi:hypothetical protein